MRVIRPAEYQVMPWKNGGGSTTELNVCPTGAVAFDWRVSIATIEMDGPFSAFDGYERHIMMLSGGGMTLDVASYGKVALRPLETFSFGGEAMVKGVLSNWPVQDFNLIVRREYGRGTLTVKDFKTGEVIGSEEGVEFFYLLGGSCSFGKEKLQANDSFLLEKREFIELASPLKLVCSQIIPW
jgi:uncharacterized protein